MKKMKVRFLVNYMDWKKGEKVDLDNKQADHLIATNTAVAVRPRKKPGPKKKEVTAAPEDKMVEGAVANK